MFATISALPRKLALAVVVAIVPLGGVQADSLSLSLNARNAQEARVLNTAISLYAIHRDIRSGANLRQIGRNHAAGIYQRGGNNRAIVHQQGRNHSARLSQTGGNNGQVIVQIGNGAHADVTQRGSEAGILLQISR
jgi:minor curlin subunit